MRQTAVVICPGRGTYTKNELGYLRRHQPRVAPFLSRLDNFLAAKAQPTVTSLDEASSFSGSIHTPGEYASTLIYACSAADFAAIDRNTYDIVAVTGNSMGWYTALALSEALSESAAFTLIHTMGSMMKDGIIGGQLIYPLVDAQWRRDPEREALLKRVFADVSQLQDSELYPSINFGGYAILGGNKAALKALMQALPPVEEGKYPFVLVNHAAFHTPMMRDVAQAASRQLGISLFQKPSLPLIDGRGVIWQPYSCDLQELRDYTLGHQVVEPYDFSAAITVALKEFAPDKLILLGPGATSGGAVAQAMIDCRWVDLKSKDDFSARQTLDPVLLAMGREDQARLVYG